MNLNQIYDNLNQLATVVPWESVLEFLAVSGVLSGVLVPVYKLVKRLFEHHKGIMQLVVALSGGAIAFGQYLIANNPNDPSVVAFQALATAFTAQAFYGVGKAVVRVLAKSWSLAEASNQKWQKDLESAKIPTAVTDTPTILPPSDFKH